MFLVYQAQENHEGRYAISVLHDDAYIINTKDGSSEAMEPTYFDKMQDYPITHPANKYLLTLMNVGVTVDEEGHKVVLAEDVRNSNGRAIKSMFWTDNRVQFMPESVNAIAWLMKDETLPPVMRITDPCLAATMGATLATKRSTAEKLDADVDRNALVIEPYANPFRTYPLVRDYESYKKLFATAGVDCYILNTGFFGDKKIPKEVTLGILEDMVNGRLHFEPFGNYKHMEYAPIKGFPVTFTESYKKALVKAFGFRHQFVVNQIGKKNELPDEVLKALSDLI